METDYLVLDDTVISKPFARNIDLARHQYSGREHREIKGIGVVNLLWTEDVNNETAYVPVDYRLYAPDHDGKTSTKGNVDAELVLYSAAKVYDNYNKAVIISGDGDFHCLIEYLLDNNKLNCVLVPDKKFSKLLKRFDKYIKRIDHAKESLRLYTKKARTNDRSKP